MQTEKKVVVIQIVHAVSIGFSNTKHIKQNLKWISCVLKRCALNKHILPAKALCVH